MTWLMKDSHFPRMGVTSSLPEATSDAMSGDFWTVPAMITVSEREGAESEGRAKDWDGPRVYCRC